MPSRLEMLTELSESGTLIPEGIYRHFKGKEYRFITQAVHSETGEELAVYQALDESRQVYVRPLSMFTEKIVRGGKEVQRFTWTKSWFMGWKQPHG